MIQKSEQQDIDRSGRRLLRAAVEPLGWVLTGFDEDYGMDYDVQVFVDGSPCGLWFKIQLKSSASSDYSSDRSFISVKLDLNHARHYALEVRDPMFVVHADIGANKVFWYAPQLDNELLRRLSTGENQSTVTLRVPATNLLPVTGQALLEAVERLYVVLGHRTLANSSLSSFAESLQYQPGEEKLREEFQQKGDFLKLRRVREFLGNRQYQEARSRAQIIASDPDASIDNRFWAQDSIGSINWSESVARNQPGSLLPQIHLENARVLQKMSKNGPPHLKFFALIARKAAELESLAAHNWGLTILLHQHRTLPGNPFMALNAFAAHALSTMRVIAKYNQCLRLASYASNFPDRWVLARALARIPQAGASFVGRIGRVEENQMGDIGKQFQSTMLGICKLIARIGEVSGDQELIALAIGSAILPVSSIETDAYRWAAGALDQISDAEVKQSARNLVNRAIKRWKGERLADDYNVEPHWELIQNAAAALGVDISDSTSALYQGLQIAAKDNSPERILRTCEHMVTSLGATGPTARKIAAVFGTQMAGSKVLHCALHKYHHEGKDFDAALVDFRMKYCSSCPDRAPRPPEWEFKGIVRQKFEAEHAQFIRDFNATGAGFRQIPTD
jgi:hypothetical protein